MIHAYNCASNHSYTKYENLAGTREFLWDHAQPNWHTWVFINIPYTVPLLLDYHICHTSKITSFFYPTAAHVQSILLRSKEVWIFHFRPLLSLTAKDSCFNSVGQVSCSNHSSATYRGSCSCQESVYHLTSELEQFHGIKGHKLQATMSSMKMLHSCSGL